MTGTFLRRLVIAIAVGALFAPVIRNVDSFPLSTQPMYATARDRTEVLASARGVVGSGPASVRLTMDLIATTDDPLIAESRLERAIASGSADDLCAEIANRVADDSRLDVTLVEILTETVDLVDFVRSDSEPVIDRVHARCAVPR